MICFPLNFKIPVYRVVCSILSILCYLQACGCFSCLFLLLATCVFILLLFSFFFFSFVSLNVGLAVLLNFSKNQHFFHWFSILVFCFQFYWFLLFIISFLLFAFGFMCSSVFLVLKWKLGWLIWIFSCFIIAFSTTNFSLSSALSVSHSFDMLHFYFQSVNYTFDWLWEFSFGNSLLKNMCVFAKYLSVLLSFCYWFLVSSHIFEEYTQTYRLLWWLRW